MAKSPDQQSNSLDTSNSVERKESAGQIIKKVFSKLVTGGLARNIGVTAALAAAGCEIDDNSSKHNSDQRSVATMKAPLTVEDFDKLDVPQKLDWTDLNPENLNICPVGDQTYSVFVNKKTVIGGDIYYTTACNSADACVPETESEITAFKNSVHALNSEKLQYIAGAITEVENDISKANVVLSTNAALLEQQAEIGANGTLEPIGELKEILGKNGNSITPGDFSLVYVGGEPHIFWNVNEPHLLNLKTKEDILVNEGGLKIAGAPSMIDGGPVVASFKGGTVSNPTYNVFGGGDLATLVTDPTPLGINDGSKSNTNPRIHTFPDGSSAVFFEKEISGVDQLHAAKFIPDEPVDGTDSTDSTEGTDVIDGTEGTDAVEGTDGTTDATDGTADVTDGTADTTDATDSTDGTEGTDTTDATDGTDTTDVTDGTEGTDTTDATEGTDTTDVTDGTEGTDTTDATEGTDTTDVTDGTEGTDTTDATEGTDTTDVTDGTEGTDATDATEGTDSVDGTVGECEPYVNGDIKVIAGNCEVKLCPVPAEDDFGQIRTEINGDPSTCKFSITTEGKTTDALMTVESKNGDDIEFTLDLTPDKKYLVKNATEEIITFDKDGHPIETEWENGALTGSSSSLTRQQKLDKDTVEITGFKRDGEKDYFILVNIPQMTVARNDAEMQEQQFRLVQIVVDDENVGVPNEINLTTGNYTKLPTDIPSNPDKGPTVEEEPGSDVAPGQPPASGDAGCSTEGKSTSGAEGMLLMALGVAALNEGRRRYKKPQTAKSEVV